VQFSSESIAKPNLLPADLLGWRSEQRRLGQNSGQVLEVKVNRPRLYWMAKRPGFIVQGNLRGLGVPIGERVG
jgi:hypothetical protein